MEQESRIKSLRVKIKSFFWHGFWTDPIIFFSLLLAFLGNAVIWGALFFTVIPTDLPVILHYNIHFGVDIIGDWKSVFFMPAAALLMLAINLVLSRYFYYKERLVAYLFATTALLVQFLMAVAVASIILINF